MNTDINTKRIRLAWPLLGLAFFLTVPVRADHGPQDTDSSYSFANVVEGPSTVIAPSGERDEVESHMPLFVGDRLWVPEGSRLEVVLSDRGLVRVEGDAEIDFAAVAYSADTNDPSTEIELRQGEIQLVVPEVALGETLPVIATPDATIYVHEPGTFRIIVSREGWTELVVREGRAEIVGDHSSSLVYPGDLAVVEGGPRPYYDVRLAGSYDSLERWGERLTREASYASVPYVDPSLHYVAAPLVEYGAWVTIGGRSAWRPRVALTWEPYHHGYWRPSPTGLIWVSYDPWGYVTHHYGLWDYVPGYGWVWYPGRSYRTAWVHWYWSPSYVGWCPSGYYASYYGGHGYGHDRGGFDLSFGIYGYAGGSWSRFEHWSFTASAHFGKRDQDRHVYSGRAMERVASARELGRGIITTDAGAAGRKDPREIVDLLESEVRDYRRETGRDLPDVSDYVARKPLPGGSREAIVKPKPITRPDPPAGRRTSVVSREFPGSSSTRKDPGRVTPVRPPREPLPRVDTKPGLDRPGLDRPGLDRPGLSRPGRETTVVTPKPRPSPSRVEKPEDRGREPEIDLRDLRDRISRTPRETPAAGPRSEDEGRTIRVKPRDLSRDEETPRTSPRSESSRPTDRISPEEVRRYRETPSVSSPERETSKPAESVSGSKPSERSEAAKKAIERAKSESKKAGKSSSTAKKSRKPKGN